MDINDTTGNPVLKFLQSRGLNTMTFLKIANIEDPSTLSRIRHGIYATIPPRVMRELVKVGAHEAPLQKAYRTWRAERQQEMLKELPPLEQK